MPVESRIPPLEAPFAPEIDAQLRSMMPAGVPAIGLFRTFVRNMPMTVAMGPWGRHELSRALSVGLRDREIVIDRTCALCGYEYEWGVHTSFFAERAGLTAAQVTSLVHGRSGDLCWEASRDQALVRLVDELHDTGDVSDELWAELRLEFDDTQILDLLMLCGWYHAISFTARATRVPLEPGAPTFDSVA